MLVRAQHPWPEPDASNQDEGVVGMVSRTAVLYVRPDEHLYLQSVVVGEDLVGEPMDVGGARVRFTEPAGNSWEAHLRLTRFRDAVAITHRDHDGDVWLTLADPFERTVREPTFIGARYDISGIVGVAASDNAA